jgi:hypothetical protein
MPLYRPTWHSEPITPGDLTVVLLTLNKPPKPWQAYHRQVLTEAIGDMPLIIVTKKELDWQRPNTTYLHQEEPGPTQDERIHNIYTQFLKATREAKTPYVATVDDDSLYPAEHFTMFRPPADKLAYNYNRWSINTWQAKPYYYHSPNPDNPMLIAPRQKLLDHMEGVPVYNGHTTHWMVDHVRYYSIEPVVCLHHIRGLVGLGIKRWKKPWPVRAWSIWKWGPVEDVVKYWNEEKE